MLQLRPVFSLTLAIVLVPSTASANAGTPLMWASMLHLVFGNLVIGLIEGVLLKRIFKTPVSRSLFAPILANYVSAWIGALLIVGLVPLVDVTIVNIRLWFGIFVLLAFALTLLIELPFFYYVMRPQGGGWGRVVRATLLVNVLSYALLVGWYGMASRTSMMTKLEVVPAGSIHSEGGYDLWFISPDGSRILRTDLGAHAQKEVIVREVDASQWDDRLFSRINAEGGYDLFLHHRAADQGTAREELIAANFAQHAPIDWRISKQPSREVEGTVGNFGPAASLASHSDWEFQTGFWAIEGIQCTNKRTQVSLRFAWETPFAMWFVRNATHLEGDTVVFQLGASQICHLDPSSGRIALIARGKGPIVAKRAVSP